MKKISKTVWIEKTYAEIWASDGTCYINMPIKLIKRNYTGKKDLKFKMTLERIR